MKDAYYFSHDSNARHDPKVLAMRSVYGAEGYGWYWMIIEMLREQPDYKLKIDKYTWNALAMQLQCDADAVNRFASDCMNEFCLLNSDGEFLWSDSLLRRMTQKDIKSEKARKAAEVRWGKTNNGKDSSDSENTSNNSIANAKQTQSKGNAIKESKGKESNVDINNNIVVIVDYLNKKADTNYKPNNKKTKQLIKARLNEGFNVDNFEKVIENKVYEWKGTDYEKYLRPETLFGTKFESYLNQRKVNNNGPPDEPPPGGNRTDSGSKYNRFSL